MTTVEPLHSFATCYMDLCRQERVRPLPMICVTLPHSLDFTTDRVKMDEWKPILNSLSLDRSLKSITVRSKYQHRKLLDQADSESKARAVGKAPVVLTRFLLEWLLHSLAQCVRNSSCLTSLELDGIPVPADILAVLCVSLVNTKSLRHLSLQRCYIGDAGCELLCKTISSAKSVSSLNLSNCDLSSSCGPALAAALSKQKLALYHEAWKQSLRYREPKLDRMPGLRRLTLNGNTKLGNEAVMAIIDAIRDSLWFKALDLQQCGLSEEMSREILDLLEHNQTLVIVDVRLNAGMREETLNEITRRLERNELKDAKSEYRWMNLPQKDSSTTFASLRVSSASNLLKQNQKDKEQEGKKGPMPIARSKSALIRQVKRPPPAILYRKPMLQPLPSVIKRMKTKPPVPEKKLGQPVKPPEQKAAPAEAMKPSLHLDLQSQIKFTSDQQVDAPCLEESVRSLPASEPVAAEDSGTHTLPDSQKIEELLQQLVELQKDRDRLLEQTRHHELILSEERARREFAEAKLRSAKDDFVELQQLVRQREQDSQEYLLISPKSMQEICLTFAHLLDMLEASKRDQIESQMEEVACEDIRRRFALIIRKTKSENLKRGHFVDEETVLPKLQLTARYGRSEGNIRNPGDHLAVPSLRIESNIGDTAETDREQPRLRPGQYSARERGCGDSAKSPADSPRDRARALFASIVNGDARLSLNPQLR